MCAESFFRLRAWSASLVVVAMLVGARSARAQTPLTVPRTSAEITLDGRFDEDAWSQAEVLPLVGYLPNPGAAPTESTVVRILHDGRAIYVAAALHDREPAGVQDWSRGRDEDHDGDFINVIIDAYGDHENAAVFSTTPAGARLDYAVSNDAEGAEPSSIAWNAFWDVRVRRDDSGWFAEFRIPFSTLRYQASDGRVQMGLIVNRRIGRKNERVIFPAIEPRWAFGMFKPSRAHPVTFHGVEHRRQRIAVPYVVVGQQRRASGGLPTDDAAVDDTRLEAGGDVKLALSDNVNLDATVNTDFAETDVDDQIINLGRFPIALPERRQFFLERAGIFDFGLGGANRLLNTRRIGLTNDGRRVPLFGGARLVGRVGGVDVGLLDMQTRNAAGQRSTNFGVMRLRGRVLNDQSYVGAMATSRAAPGERDVAGGVDATVRVGGPHYLRVATAVVDAPTGVAGGTRWRDRSGIYTRLERRSTIGLGGSINFLDLGTAFTPPVGFVESPGIQQLKGRISYGILAPARSALRLVTPALQATRTRDLAAGGALQTMLTEGGFDAELRSGATFGLAVRRHHEVTRQELGFADGFVVPAGDYQFTTASASVGTAPSGVGTLTAELRAGGFYGGRRVSSILSGTWHPTPLLIATVDYVHERLSRDTSAATLRLIRVRTIAMPSARHSASATAQLTTAAQLASVNARWRVNFREGTDLWLVYDHVLNTDRFRETPPLARTAANSLLLKVTYAFAN